MNKHHLIADRRVGEPLALGAALCAGKKVAPEATQLLMEDHRTVLGWFRWYEQAPDSATRNVLVRRICGALRAHMAGEERWLYPAAREALGDGDLVERSIREHQAAKDLMTELAQEPASVEQAAYVARLREEIQTHVLEEETELFPRLAATHLDLYALGRLVAAERAARLYEAQGRTPPTGQTEELPRMEIAESEAREFYVVGLKNAHATAREGRAMFETQVKRLEQYPTLKAQLERSLAARNQQLERLQTLLDEQGESRSALKDAAMTAAAGIASIANTAADDEIVKNSFTTLAHAKFAGAAYETLLLFGQAAGVTPDRLRLLQLCLSEERELACFIEDNLRPTGMRFLQLRSERQQASH
jgi:ferritin-like metal-binding protein YciE/hemerythrin superfamily protein